MLKITVKTPRITGKYYRKVALCYGSGWYTQGAESVCLADFCDIFRCDVLLRRTEQRYWGLALCRENDLHRKKQRCLVRGVSLRSIGSGATGVCARAPGLIQKT